MVNRVHLYQDKNGEWRWRFIAKNQRLLANGGEGYKNRQDCIDSAEMVTGTSFSQVDAARDIIWVVDE